MSSSEKSDKHSHEVSKAGADSFGNGYNASSEAERRGSLAVNLNANKEGRIQNVLADIPHDKLMRDVENFAKEAGLDDSIPLLKKGALLGQNPSAFETMQDLDAHEKDMLRKEVTHKWHQPRDLYLTIIVCSIGAAVQGWDQTGSNGANLSFPEALGISEAANNPNHKLNSWIVGVVNAAPYMSSAILGCWLGDPLNNFFGRRGTIFFSAVFCLFSVLGSAFAQTWEQLLVCRLLLGIGMGSKASTVSVYCAENSPAPIRGALVMSWQMWTAFGIFLGFSANLAVYQVGPIAWRLQLGSAFIPAVPLLIGIYFCPESPRWYLKKGKYERAFKSLLRLRNTPIQAARDLYYIHSQLKEEALVFRQTGNYAQRLTELFTVPRIRRATLASFTVMLAQQICGINIIAFYSSTVFVQAGANARGALFASWGFGLVNFIFAWPAIFTIDTFGRRSLLLFTFPNMFWTLLAAGLCNIIPVGDKAHLVTVALFVYLFAIFYSVGEGPVPFVYSAEVFPLSHREIGMGWATATTFFFASVLSLTFPSVLAAFGVTGTFCFYAGLNLVALTMIFLFAPETKQRTLEELDFIFAVPTTTFIRYQCTKAVPHFFRRYVLFKKNEHIEPLYHLDQPNTVEVVREVPGKHGQQVDHVDYPIKSIN